MFFGFLITRGVVSPFFKMKSRLSWKSAPSVRTQFLSVNASFSRTPPRKNSGSPGYEPQFYLPWSVPIQPAATTPQSVTKTKALRSAPHGGISLAQAHPPTCALPNKDQTRPQDPTCRMRREQRVNGSFSDSITATGHFQRRVQADYDGVSDKMLPERSGNRREVEAREIKRLY